MVNVSGERRRSSGGESFFRGYSKRSGPHCVLGDKGEGRWNPRRQIFGIKQCRGGETLCFNSEQERAPFPSLFRIPLLVSRGARVRRSHHSSYLVEASEFSRRLSEKLGKSSPEGMDRKRHYQEESGAEEGWEEETGRSDAPCTLEWVAYSLAREIKDSSRQGSKTRRKRERREEGCSRAKQRSCRVEWPQGQAGWVAKAAQRSEEGRRSGSHRCGGLVRVTRSWRSFRLCGGPVGFGTGLGRSPRSRHVETCSGPGREARGFKRWFFEREEEEASEGEEEEGERRTSESASCSGRTTAEAAIRRKEKERQEKEKLRLKRGKGVGEVAQWKEKKKEGRGEPRSLQQQLGQLRGVRGGVVELGLSDVGPTAEEELEETRSCFKNAHQPCSTHPRPDVGAGSRRVPRGDQWGEDGNLLQLADQAVPSFDESRYEGTSLSVDLRGRAEERKARSFRRQLGVPVFGSAQCGERRGVEDGATFGTPPPGGSTIGSNTAPPGSKAAFEAGGKEPRARRQRERLEEKQRARLEKRRLDRKERKRQREERKGERLWKGRLWKTGFMAGLARRSWRKSQLVGQEQGEERKRGWKREEGRQVTGGHLFEVMLDYDRGEEASGGEKKVREKDEAVYERGEEASRDDENKEEDETIGMRQHEYSGLDIDWGRGFEFIGQLAGVGSNLGKLGVCMAWMVCQAKLAKDASRSLKTIWGLLAGFDAGSPAVHRSYKKGAYPLRLGRLSDLWEILARRKMSEVLTPAFVEDHKEDAWLFCCVQYCNFQAGSRALDFRRWRAWELRVVATLRNSVARTLSQDAVIERSEVEVEKELSSRFLSYTGEEIPKLEVLTIEQVEPSLPPKSHGGAIRALSWVSGRTKQFLEHPEDCVLDPSLMKKLPKLQARVHVASDDKVELAKLLVERGICGWTEESAVFRYEGEMVLNGLFGVPKPTVLADGRHVLRLIMNLIPSNSVMQQVQGSVYELPMVTQYLSITLEEGETLRMSQSDMTAAFYLFGMEEAWSRFLCFNLAVEGSEIGKVPNKRYYLCCRVLPMGWSSAVAVMQEISQTLLHCFGLPKRLQVKRTRGLPAWLCEAIGEAAAKKCAWWHIYLDNFFAGEKCAVGESAEEASRLHDAAEAAWNATGVLSSAKKKVAGAETVDELGARFGGDAQYLGVSGERLIKVIQTTAVVLSKVSVPKKWLQVVAGRWIHVLQFRRSGMSTLHLLWKWIGGKRLGAKKLVKAREELLMLMLGAPLFHTFLGASVSGITTCSDASGQGGAVGSSEKLTEEGKDFVCSQRMAEESGPQEIPELLVLSLFNGVGGAFRCYDVLGVQPGVLISCEIDASANRVVFRRWPHAKHIDDVRSIDEAMIRRWLFEFPLVTLIHLWAGFPCVDLSSVKFGRKNLKGSESSLFFEITRILRILRQVFGREVKVSFFVENVASMDKEAMDEISQHLGVVPYRVQCSEAVPISRPRLCWTDEEFSPMPGLKLKDKGRYQEIAVEARYPQVWQWLREDSMWPGQESGAIFPTCMKNIKRSRPPPAPAGLDRADYDTRCRWTSDDFRYPPYQYKAEYVIYTKNGSWRLLEASERELLHGYGWEHTSVCWSASKIKQDKAGYESCRCSQIGDSFSIYSFVIFPWMALRKMLPQFDYSHLTERMGLSPGYTNNVLLKCPLRRKLRYGGNSNLDFNPQDLARVMLGKVNHTGSDVRVSTGAVMCPRAYPRQSANASWWEWQGVFSTKWLRSEHINALEMRAILLALQWRTTHLQETECRMVHLTDSYVSMSIIFKGRTSSDQLLGILRRISAICFSFGIFPVLVHVESTENPTDAASRGD